MAAYYNEIDKYCAGWLRNLASANLIPAGDVDERSIEKVSPDDLTTYTQCHFFAGIAGWPLALRLAGWDDRSPAWTGSCPCQPFSAAGQRKGQADHRHLWPAWFRLIRERRPPVVFGEQVAAAIAFGWLDEVFHDLEAEGYACGAAVLPACAVGAPHRRDRIYFVADAAGKPCRAKATQTATVQAGIRGAVPEFPATGAVADAVVPAEPRLRQHGGTILPEQEAEFAGARGFLGDLLWIQGPDGKARPVEPGIRLLADGVPARLGRLRAYGNAIVPPLAAEFISAYRESRK